MNLLQVLPVAMDIYGTKQGAFFITIGKTKYSVTLSLGTYTGPLNFNFAQAMAFALILLGAQVGIFKVRVGSGMITAMVAVAA